MNKETNNNQNQIPQGFKQTEIGLIPEDWEVLDFESTLAENDFSRDNLIPSSDFKTEGKYPIIDQGQAYIAGYTDQKDKVFEVKEPVILFGDHTRIFKYIDFPFVGGADGVKIFTPNNNLYDSRFYYYALTNLKIPSRGYNRHYKLLKEQKIVKPPLHEQKKIAYVLSKIQQAIETQEKIIKTTQELKKALMQKLFTEGLNGEPQKQTEIGLIPQSWEVVELRKVCDQRKENYVPKQDGNSIYVGLEHITTGEFYLSTHSYENNVVSSKYKFYCGDILYGKLRPYLDKAVIANSNGICSTDIIVIKPKVENKFLLSLLHSERLIKHSIAHTSGVNHPRTSFDALSRFRFALPNSAQQKTIGDSLFKLEDKILIHKNLIDQLKEVFNSMLNNLMTGQIRVKDIEFKLEETAKAVD